MSTVRTAVVVAREDFLARLRVPNTRNSIQTGCNDAITLMAEIGCENLVCVAQREAISSGLPVPHAGRVILAAGSDHLAVGTESGGQNQVLMAGRAVQSLAEPLRTRVTMRVTSWPWQTVDAALTPLSHEGKPAGPFHSLLGTPRTASWVPPESSLNTAGNRGSNITLPTRAENTRRTAGFWIAWALPARLLGLDAATPWTYNCIASRHSCDRCRGSISCATSSRPVLIASAVKVSRYHRPTWFGGISKQLKRRSLNSMAGPCGTDTISRPPGLTMALSAMTTSVTSAMCSTL